jgi:hypothetical protein
MVVASRRKEGLTEGEKQHKAKYRGSGQYSDGGEAFGNPASSFTPSG